MSTKLKFAVLGSSVLLIAAMVFAHTLPIGIASYFAYNKYEGLSEASNPSGNYIASWCHIMGGATTTDSTFVVIRSKGESLDYKRNDLLFMIDNLEPLDVSWLNDRELKIGYKGGPIYIQKSNWKDIVVTYIELPHASTH